MKQTADDFDLPAYLSAVAAQKGRLILAGTLACGVALLVSQFLPKTYETHFTIRIGRVWFEGSQAGSYNRNVYVETAPEMSEIMTSPAFLKKISDDLGLDIQVRALRKRIRPEYPERWDLQNVGVLTVGVRGPTPQLARLLASAVAEGTVERHNKSFHEAAEVRSQWENDLAGQIKTHGTEIESLGSMLRKHGSGGGTVPPFVVLQTEMETRFAQVSRLKDKYRQVQLENTEFMSRQSQIVSPPYLPEKPIKPNARLNAGLGAAAGLFLYLAYIFVKEAVRVGSTPR